MRIIPRRLGESSADPRTPRWIRGTAEGGEGAEVFLALETRLAAMFQIFRIVVKGREKD